MYKRLKRWMRSLAITPLVFLVTLYILFEDFLHNVVRPFVTYIAALRLLQIVEVFLQKRNPYTLLGISVCKLATFSGIKIFSLYLISHGNMLGGPLLVCGELTGAVLTVWYAKVALPRLMTIGKFANLYNKVKDIKSRWIHNLQQTRVYQYAKIIRERIRTMKELVRNRAKRTFLAKAIYRLIQHKSQEKS